VVSVRTDQDLPEDLHDARGGVTELRTDLARLTFRLGHDDANNYSATTRNDRPLTSTRAARHPAPWTATETRRRHWIIPRTLNRWASGCAGSLDCGWPRTDLAYCAHGLPSAGLRWIGDFILDTSIPEQPALIRPPVGVAKAADDCRAPGVMQKVCAAMAKADKPLTQKDIRASSDPLAILGN
jgi:hypothetical protein